MHNSLKSRILDYLRKCYDYRPQSFVNGGAIEDLARNACGRKASNASRRLRELENEGAIEVHYNEKGHAEYRYVPVWQRIKNTV